MKLILSGWEGSKKIIPASSFLVKKYLGNMFDIYWVSFGPYTDRLFCGTYQSLDDTQVNGFSSWSRYMKDYLSNLTDELIVLGMDDFLLSGPIDRVKYNKLLSMMSDEIICAKLCTSDFHKPSEYDMLDDEVMQLNNTAEFSAVGQYCIWNRKFLIDLLDKTTDPWHFEGAGSIILNATGKKVIGTHSPTLPYPDRSAMSRSWPGKIKVVGNPKNDIDYLIRQQLLQQEDILYD